ncbi:MAG: prolyl oligopeptidase family serine peptidase [Thermomicrobiales bacterium]
MSLPITPEAIVWDLPTIAAGSVSPDGEHILYTVAKPDRETGKGDSQIWIANIDGTERRQLTQVGTGNSNPLWSPDGSQIAYVSQREGDRPVAIVVMPFAAGGEAKVVTSHTTPPMSLAWSPDGTTLLYNLTIDPENPDETPLDPKAPPKPRIVTTITYKFDGFGYRGKNRFQVHTVDVASGERRCLTSGLFDYMNLAWSPDGSTIGAIAWMEGPFRSTIATIDAESGEVTHLTEPGMVKGLLSWSPDGSRLLFDTEMSGLAYVDVATKATHEVNPDLGFQPDGMYAPGKGPIWLDEETVLVHGFGGTRSGLWKVTLQDGEVTYIAQWDAFHGGITPIPGTTSFIQSTNDLSGGIGLARIDGDTGEKTQLFTIADDFFGEHAPAQWEIVSVHRGDWHIEGILLKPADFDPRKRYPVVLDVHGGPQGAFHQAISPDAEVLATNGFIVLMPNPRGSTGYGKDFSFAVYDDWGNEDWKDLQALLDTVLARPYADADRTGIIGYSYGGYMTSWAIGHTDRFKAAVCGSPPFDLEAMYGSSDISWLLGGMQWGGAPWEAREEYARLSPSGFIQNATTPTLIIQGEADERCPVGQAEQLFISLRALGVETEMARYPGGFHGFIVQGEPTHRIDYYQRALDWFKTYLGDPADA